MGSQTISRVAIIAAAAAAAGFASGASAQDSAGGKRYVPDSSPEPAQADRRGDRGGRNDTGRGGARGDSITLGCSSNEYGYRFCPVRGNIGSVRLIDNRSRADCDRGRDWGWSRDGIWVDNGCRGDFLVTFGGGRGSTGYEYRGGTRRGDDRGYGRGYDRDNGRYGSYGRSDRGEIRRARYAARACLDEARYAYGLRYADLYDIVRFREGRRGWQVQIDAEVATQGRGRGYGRSRTRLTRFSCQSDGYRVRVSRR